jgi:signal peptidase II
MLMAFGKTLDSSLRSPKILGLAAAATAVFLDQAHKFWMLDIFGVAGREPIRLAPFLDVMLSWNRGISYSLLSAQGDVARYGLLALQLAIVAGLCAWLWRTPRRVTALALGLIIGGAIGNATDRLRYGAVADFFFLHTSLPVGPLANYVFNVADALITLGVVLMLLDAARGAEGQADAAR